MISQTAEYALRAVVFLAMNFPLAYTTQQIALSTRVPAAYLAKVLLPLVRAGIVQSQRGNHGGFVFSRSAYELTILDILNTVDPLQKVKVCPFAQHSAGGDLCALYAKLDEACEIAARTLDNTRIGDLLDLSKRSPPACDCSPKGSAEKDEAAESNLSASSDFEAARST